MRLIRLFGLIALLLAMAAAPATMAGTWSVQSGHHAAAHMADNEAASQQESHTGAAGDCVAHCCGGGVCSFLCCSAALSSAPVMASPRTPPISPELAHGRLAVAAMGAIFRPPIAAL